MAVEGQEIQRDPPIVESASSVSSTTKCSKEIVRSGCLDLEKLGEDEGYVLDEARLRDSLSVPSNVSLRKDSHGRILVPQPSDDAADPLNWPRWRKALIMFMIALSAFTADYSAATASSALVPQATEWGVSPDTVNHATAGNSFMLGVGGLVVVWLSAWVGRLPVLFYFMILSSATAVWMAAAQSFESYLAARIFNGFFSVAAAGGGLMWINDMFFFHQRPQMINIWSTAIILSPFLGPQIMSAIIGVSTWRVGMWLDFGLITLGLLVVGLLGEETFYPRHLARDAIAPRKSRLMRLVGIEQVRSNYTSNSFLESGGRLYKTIIKLPIFLTCFFYFFDFGWTIANNTTISVFIIPEYDFTFRNLAAIYSAPVIGAALGMGVGHFLLPLTGDMYARYHDGRIDPEARLIACWLVLPIKIVGYNLIGSTLHQHWSYWILAVGWGMHTFGTIITTSSVGAYLIDSYPEASGESAAWLNAARLLGGFIIGYIQIGWCEAQGTQTTYGIQSAIMAGAFFIVVGLQFSGANLRHKCGRLEFRTN